MIARLIPSVLQGSVFESVVLREAERFLRSAGTFQTVSFYPHKQKDAVLFQMLVF